MICDKCGSKIDENSSFCPKCGNIIEKKTENNTNEQVNNLDIFTSNYIAPNTENSEPEENLIEKYKTNINFFKLSDNQKQDDNLLINEPVFPQNSFDTNTQNEQNIKETNQMIEPVNITPINDLINDTQMETNTPEINPIDSLNNPVNTNNEAIVQDNLNYNITPEVNPVDSLNNPVNTNNEAIVQDNLNYNITPEINPVNNLNNPEIQPNQIDSPNTQETNQVGNSNDSQNNAIKPKKDKNNNLIVFVAIAFIAIIVIAVILINGSKKTLTCTTTTTEGNLNIKSSISTTFKDDKIQTMVIKGKEQISEDGKQYIDLYFNYKLEELNKYTQIAGVIVTTNKQGNAITYSVTADKTNSKQLFEEEFGKIEITAENFTSAAEAQGYKCSTK